MHHSMVKSTKSTSPFKALDSQPAHDVLGQVCALGCREQNLGEEHQVCDGSGVTVSEYTLW